MSLSINVNIPRTWLTGSKGQATVESAFAIPLIFMLLLMLLQPGIILYDRMVMEGAASEGCRMLSTYAPSGMSQARIEELVKHRLGAIPPQDLFHKHAGGCSWDIQLQGSDTSSQVSVQITNRIKLLPVLDVSASLLGVADGQGCIPITVIRTATTQPGWVQASGISPDSWVAQRL